MPFVRYSSSTARANLTRPRRYTGSSWVDIQTARRFNGSSWVTFWTAYTAPRATLNSTSAFGHTTGTNTLGYVRSDIPVSVSASGGTGNYSYAWERVSGTANIRSVSPSSISTHFDGNLTEGSFQAVFRCRVTDGVSTVYTPNVLVTLSYRYIGGGGEIPP